MNILISLTYYSPYISGLTLYGRRLAEGLSQRNHSVKVLTMQYDVSLPQKTSINGISVTRASHIGRISKGFLSIDWVIKSFTEVTKTDTLIVNLPQPEAIFPALWAKLLGKKTISIYHCDLVLPDGLVNKGIQKMVDFLHILILRLSHEIVTNSSDFAQNSRILPSFSKKITYVYPPVEIPKVNKRTQKMFIHKLGKKKRFHIGIVGRIATEKGYEYLFEAIPFLKKALGNGAFTILWCGPKDTVGEQRYREKIRMVIGKYRDNIIQFGELREEELGSFYSLLDVLVVPSVNSTEAFGMTQIEAMMQGVPVVASDLPGVRVPIQKTGMGIIVPVGNSQRLTKAIYEVLSHKYRYMKKKKFIRDIFSIQKTLTEFRTLLRE